MKTIKYLFILILAICFFITPIYSKVEPIPKEKSVLLNDLTMFINLGFDQNFWNHPDETTTNTLLQTHVDDAELRLRNIVGDTLYDEAVTIKAKLPEDRTLEEQAKLRRLEKAEYYFSLINILETAWIRNSTGEEFVTIEGNQVKMTNPSVEDRREYKRTFLGKASFALKPYLGNTRSSPILVA